MSYSKDELNWIYDRTNGRCHICGKKVYFINYANAKGRGAWEVEHSNPKVKGGTSYLRNLYPACISCNREKGTATSRTARSWYGRTRAPLSKQERIEVKQQNAMIGAGIFGVVGAIIASSTGIGALVGAIAGSVLCYNIDPDE